MAEPALKNAAMELLRYNYLSKLNPDKQAAYLKKVYGTPESIKKFAGKTEIEQGIYPFEKKLHDKYIIKKGGMLVVGCSGGREAIHYAKAGFEVTGIDIVKGMIDKARYWAWKYGLGIKYEVKDICDYSPKKGAFSYALFTVYNCVVGRQKRIFVLKILRRALTDKGLIFITYHHPKAQDSRINDRRLRRDLAGRVQWYEKNDFSAGAQIMHQFSRAELRAEAKEAGFRVIDWSLGSPPWSARKYGVAVLRKFGKPRRRVS